MVIRELRRRMDRRIEDQGGFGGDIGGAGDGGKMRSSGRVAHRIRTLPSKTVPRMPSCRQSLAGLRVCRRRPGRPFWRWFRFRRASGHRPCRDRGQSCGCGWRSRAAAVKSSMWSISAPSAPVMPAATSARRIAQVKAVRARPGRRRVRNGWSPTRKNQLPPQATSPVTVP